MVTAASISAPQAIQSKQAEAQRVLGEIQQIDSHLGHVVDQYNAATDRLSQLQQQLDTAKRRLGIAKSSNAVAQKTLQQRVVALYENGGDSNVLEVILGASSLDDLLNRVDAAKRVSGQDAKILTQIEAARTELAKEESTIEKSLAEQKRVVAERAAVRAQIESQLGERKRLYDSIKSQIVQLQAQERARQKQLIAEAERRLAAASAAAATQAITGTTSVVQPTPVQPAPTVSPTPSVIPAAPAATYGGVVGIAMQYLGTPYVWAGASPGGFDCSGFVMYVYGQVGVSLPHNAAAQYGYGSPVSRDQLAPGDLVFFDGLGHVGIYIGGGQFIHSPHTGDVVKISSLSDSWYAATYVGARRIA